MVISLNLEKIHLIHIGIKEILRITNVQDMADVCILMDGGILEIGEMINIMVTDSSNLKINCKKH